MIYVYICMWSRLRLTFCTGTCVLLLYSVCKEYILLCIFRLHRLRGKRYMYTTSLSWFTSLQFSMQLKVQCNFDDVSMKTHL